jgi:sugar O-acyltransferase (sialic acid O-acetyltransferase NeuD family)
MVAAVQNSIPIIIVGAGGFGREVAAGINRYNLPYDVIGHIDDEKSGPTILGKIVDHDPVKSAWYLTCFGDGAARHRVRTMLEARGARFTCVTSPMVVAVTATADLVNGIFLGMCSISNDIQIGADVLIQTMAVIGHDVKIGDGVTISSHAFVGGWAVLEPFCTIHPHAVVLPKVTVGEGAVVGAGSVVIRDVAPYTTVFGSPAKVIAYGKPHD